MNESMFSLEKFSQGIQLAIEQVYHFAPKLIAAILILIIGWLLAKLLRVGVSKLIGQLDQAWKKLLARGGYTSLQTRQPPMTVIGQAVYWLVILIALTFAAEILSLDIFVTGLKEILGYLPLVIGAILIMLVGFIISTFVRDLVASAAVSADISHAELLANSAQLVVLFIAIVLGIEQVGINTYFLSIVSGIVLAAILGGFAIAFGLGARTHVSNIIAANQLRQIYQIGDQVQIGDVEGRIIDIFATRVVLENENGRIDIPAKLFDEAISFIVEKGSE